MELVELASDGRRATHDAMCDPEGNGWQCDKRLAAAHRRLLFVLAVFTGRGDFLCLIGRGRKKGLTRLAAGGGRYES